jgi:ketosteroid isomerase-like protein
MQIVAEPITGAEAHDDTSEPIQALRLFYAALNARKLELMQVCWSPTEEASMDNPLGGIVRGWSAIASVYSRLFNADVRYRFEFHDYSTHPLTDCFLVVGRERGWIEKAGNRLDLAFRTSRFFRLEGGHWKQLHHHGSADDPNMLREYQDLILTQ